MSDTNKPGAAHSSQTDSGARVRGVFALAPQVVTSAQVLTGTTIDRKEQEMPLSVQFALPVKITSLASGEEMDITVAIQHAAASDPLDPSDDTADTFASYDDGDQDEVFTIAGNDDASTIETTLRVNVDLSGAKRFVRARVTVPASGENVAIGCVCIIGGAETYPL
jgi:hypothetical protein